MFKNLFLIAFLFFFSTFVFAQNKSVFTPISNAECETKKTSPVSGYLICPGAGDYHLEVLDDDARMSINVIAPDKKVYELNFWGHFRRFSFVGEKVEWRIKSNTPVALIIRYNVSNPNDETKNISYLMVAKISKTKTCLTDIVKPGKNQNLTAQKLADASAKKACKKIPE